MTDSTFTTYKVFGKSVDLKILSAQVGDREAKIIQTEISEAAEPLGWRIAIDMSHVAFLASAGLGALVGAHNAAKQAKGKLAVYNVKPDLLEMLKLTHLDKLFTIKDDQASALKAVK